MWACEAQIPRRGHIRFMRGQMPPPPALNEILEMHGQKNRQMDG